jgi:uncharacterized protein (TIGR02996 family)
MKQNERANMSSRESFLAEIIANPEDDAPRLVFADWLEDNGDPNRAEFIRLQIRLDSMPEYDPDRFDLEERALDLLAEHREKWLVGLPAWARKEPLTFRRGFVGEVKLPPGRFHSSGDKLVGATPLLRLTLEGLNDKAAELAQVGAFAQLSELEVEMGKSDVPRLSPFISHLPPGRLRQFGLNGGPSRYGSIKELSRWPGLSGLKSLKVHHIRCSDAEVAVLFSLKHLRDLQRLELHLTGTVPSAAASVRHLSQLKHLTLGYNEADPAGIKQLVASDWRQLESLDLDSHKLNTEDFRSLAGSRWFSGLRSLRVYGSIDPCPVLVTTPVTLRHLWLSSNALSTADLCRSGLAEGLHSLTLWTSEVSLRDLSDSSRLRQLRQLTVSSHKKPPSDVDLCSLIDSPGLPALTQLRIDCQLDRDGAEQLARLASLSRLKSLSLWDCRLGNAGMRALAASRHLSGLKRFHITDKSDTSCLPALLEAPWLESLRELRVKCTGIDDDALVALANCPALSRLRVLILGQQKITRKGAAALAESPHLGRLLQLTVSASYTHSREVRDPLVARFGGVYVETH